MTETLDFLANSLLAVLGIGLLIFIHEAGHYIAARMAGVRVHVFSLGFGPRLFGFRRNGTDYRIAAVPVGGYVRVAGEDPVAPRHDLPDDDLHAKSFGQRLLFYSGGVIMNVLFALIVFPIVFRTGVAFTAPVVGSVEPGSPAWHARIEPGDRIVSVGDRDRVRSFEALTQDIALSAGEPLSLGIERGDARFDVDVEPRYDAADGFYKIGISNAWVEEPVRLTGIEKDGPAARAGLENGDELLAFDGERLIGREMATHLAEAAEDKVGKTVALVVRGEDGEERRVEYLPGETETAPRIGVLLGSRTVAGIRGGLEALDRLGLQRGDRIVAVDGAPFAGDGLERIRAAARDDGKLELAVITSEGNRRTASGGFDATAADALEDHLALETDPADVVLVPQAGSQAERAGIEAGDVVVAIGGRTIHTFDDLRDAVGAAGTREMKVALRRPTPGAEEATADVEITLAPARAKVADFGFVPQLDLQRRVFQVDSFTGAVAEGFAASIDLVGSLYMTLKRMFTGDVAAKNLGGIITISRVSHHFASEGWAQLFFFLSLLSLNLAFINFLPIPVLDGGHVLFLVIEKIKGSPVSETVFHYSQLVGLAFVLALMVFVTYNDVLRIL